MNRCLEETNIPERMTKGKTTLIQKEPPQQLQTHDVPIDDVENTNGTNQGRCSIRKKKAVDGSPKNRKDVTREQEEQKIYNRLINASSKRAKWDGKL